LSYLLDTNTVSYLLSQSPAIRAKVHKAGGLNVLAISTISVAELYYGVMVMPEGRRKKALLASIETVLSTGLEVIPLWRQAAKTFGDLGATLKGAGVAYNFQDLAIASIALTEDRIVASNDRFFENAAKISSLRVERWAP
jgi:predicted nucleic acid-binding protein